MKYRNSFFAFIIAIFLIVSSCGSTTPLIKASTKGDSLAIQKLIDEGADVNAADKKGYTPLIWAVHLNDSKIANILIEKGANINSRDINGYTPLLWAIDCGYLEIAMVLIEKGADINLADNNGTTPLIKACNYGHIEFAKILFGRNVDVLATDSSGQKASDYVNAALISFKRAFNKSYKESLDSFWKQLADKEASQLPITQISYVPTVSKTGRDDRFLAYCNGTVLDTQTNLMWAAKDNGEDINWKSARRYCENYRGGGYKDWRMPTPNELASLYDNNKSRPAECNTSISIHVATEFINITCFAPWASEKRASEAAYFNFYRGYGYWFLQLRDYYYRALPVRSAK